MEIYVGAALGVLGLFSAMLAALVMMRETVHARRQLMAELRALRHTVRADTVAIRALLMTLESSRLRRTAREAKARLEGHADVGCVLDVTHADRLRRAAKALEDQRFADEVAEEMDRTYEENRRRLV